MRHSSITPPARIDIERLEAALVTVAVAMLENMAYAPIFERLDRELNDALAQRANDPVTRMRHLLKSRSS